MADSSSANGSVAELAAGLAAKDPAASGKLYERYQRGVRYYVRHLMGPGDDVEDCIQHVFAAVIESVGKGNLRDASRLSGFVRACAYNVSMKFIGERIERRSQLTTNDEGVPLEQLIDPRTDGEAVVLHWDRVRLAEKALQMLRPIDREVLTRFYLNGESGAQIQAAMHLDDVQYRLLKSRAKAKVVSSARRLLETKPKRLESAPEKRIN